MSQIPTTGTVSIVIQMPGDAGGNANGTGGTPENPSFLNPNVDKKVTNPLQGNDKSKAVTALIAQQVVSVGRQGLSAAISNIGLSTGNYYLQHKVERNINALSQAGTLGLAFMTNPVLGASMLAGMAVSSASETYKQNKEREIANYESAQYARRLGYTVGRR